MNCSVVRSSRGLFLSLMLAVLLCSCASPGPPADSREIATESKKPGSSSSASKKREPYNGKVLIVEGSVPGTVEYEIIEDDMEVVKRWYGALDESYLLLAKAARSLGANAVINARVWIAPSIGAWASPHGAGQAVFIKDPKKIELLERQGGRFW